MLSRRLRQHDAIITRDSIHAGIDIDLVIPPGETGRIVDIDPETGDFACQLDTHFPQLRHRRNMIFLSADESFLIERQRVSQWQRLARNAVIGTFALAFGWLCFAGNNHHVSKAEASSGNVGHHQDATQTCGPPLPKLIGFAHSI